MRVTTLNANGIRSAGRRGFFAWAAKLDADVICLQETRAQEHQLSAEASALAGYTGYFVDARRRGYSGVAIYSRLEPVSVRRTLGWDDMDAEGRFIQADFGSVSVSSLYVPSGISGPARQAFKMDFLERLLVVLTSLRHSGRSQIVCGDFNIAHKPPDTYNPARNALITGFLPEERAWLDTLVEKAGWVRRVSRRQSRSRAVHVVVELAGGLGPQSRLAHRLSARHARLSRPRRAGFHLQRRTFQRPRASDG